MIALAALAGCARKPGPAPSSRGSGTASPPSTTPWCGEGWRTIDASTCLALPERFADPPSLVIFAHGMLAPHVQPTDEQATLLAAARAHGFAVLFGRGREGLCKWQPDLAEHCCWPTTQSDVDRETPEIVAAWLRAQRRAEGMAGVRFSRRYLVGFSNGGYFTAFVTAEGLMPIDGAAVVGAGRSVVDRALLGASRPPLYLAVGAREAEVTQRDAATLAQALMERAWPVAYVVHPDRGHAIQGDDLALAWATWGR